MLLEPYYNTTQIIAYDGHEKLNDKIRIYLYRRLPPWGDFGSFLYYTFKKDKPELNEALYAFIKVSRKNQDVYCATRKLFEELSEVARLYMPNTTVGYDENHRIIVEIPLDEFNVFISRTHSCLVSEPQIRYDHYIRKPVIYLPRRLLEYIGEKYLLREWWIDEDGNTYPNRTLYQSGQFYSLRVSPRLDIYYHKGWDIVPAFMPSQIGTIANTPPNRGKRVYIRIPFPDKSILLPDFPIIKNVGSLGTVAFLAVRLDDIFGSGNYRLYGTKEANEMKYLPKSYSDLIWVIYFAHIIESFDGDVLGYIELHYGYDAWTFNSASTFPHVHVGSALLTKAQFDDAMYDNGMPFYSAEADYPWFLSIQNIYAKLFGGRKYYPEPSGDDRYKFVDIMLFS